MQQLLVSQDVRKALPGTAKLYQMPPRMQPKDTNCSQRVVTLVADQQHLALVLEQPLASVAAVAVTNNSASDGAAVTGDNGTAARDVLEQFAQLPQARSALGVEVTGRLRKSLDETASATATSASMQLRQVPHSFCQALMEPATVQTAGGRKAALAAVEASLGNVLTLRADVLAVADNAAREARAAAKRLSRAVAAARFSPASASPVGSTDAQAASIVEYCCRAHSDRVCDELLLLSSARPPLSWTYLLASTMSSAAGQDVTRVEAVIPAHTSQDSLVPLVVLQMMLHVNAAHARDAAATATRMLDNLYELRAELRRAVDSTLANEGSSAAETARLVKQQAQLLRHAADLLCNQLQAKRYHAVRTDNTSSSTVSIAVDPRLVYAEFNMSSLLRARQVELVRQFQSAAGGNASLVHQMLMGQGKTYVIAPILALMLADGNSMVTNVVPLQLLNMSRDALRAVLCTPVLDVRVHTFRFDRAVGQYTPPMDALNDASSDKLATAVLAFDTGAYYSDDEDEFDEYDEENTDEDDMDSYRARQRAAKKKRLAKAKKEAAKQKDAERPTLPVPSCLRDCVLARVTAMYGGKLPEGVLQKPTDEAKDKGKNKDKKAEVDAATADGSTATVTVAEAGPAAVQAPTPAAETATEVMWPLDSQQHDRGLAVVYSLLSSLTAARDGGAVVCTTADALKSLLLRYLDILEHRQDAANKVAQATAVKDAEAQQDMERSAEQDSKEQTDAHDKGKDKAGPKPPLALPALPTHEGSNAFLNSLGGLGDMLKSLGAIMGSGQPGPGGGPAAAMLDGNSPPPLVRAPLPPRKAGKSKSAKSKSKSKPNKSKDGLGDVLSERVYGLIAEGLARMLRLFKTGQDHPQAVDDATTALVTAPGSPAPAVPSPRPCRGIGLLDEVDLLMHPLKSELNFPIGSKKILPLAPFRWELPIFLVEAVMAAYKLHGLRKAAATSGVASGSILPAAGAFSPAACAAVSHVPLSEVIPPERANVLGTADAQGALLDLAQAMTDGLASHVVQDKPHLVLYSGTYYSECLALPVARIALAFCTAGGPGLTLRRELAKAATHTPAGARDEVLYFLTSTYRDERSPRFVATLAVLRVCLSPASMQRLVCARQWVTTYLPHCLRKVDRVAYGLLPAPLQSSVKDGVTITTSGGGRHLLRSHGRPPVPEGTANTASDTLSRKLLAVPFVGKDVPSLTSEFSHPDMRIGLTALACTHEGLRPNDMATIAQRLKTQMMRETGTFEERPARVLWQSWINEAARHVASATGQAGEAKTPGRPLSLSRAASSGAGTTAATADHAVNSDATAMAHALSTLLPLELFQPDERAHIRAFHTACRRLPGVVAYHLSVVVFPVVTPAQDTKLSGSGHDLASETLFDVRLGFSGTPNELVPLSLSPVRFEASSEASIYRTLSSPQHVDVARLPSWDVITLLRYVASSGRTSMSTVATTGPRFHALIDIGALVAGLSNKGVAAALLILGLPHVDGCIYMDENDRRVVLLRPRDAAVGAGTGPQDGRSPSPDSESTPAAEDEDGPGPSIDGAQAGPTRPSTAIDAIPKPSITSLDSLTSDRSFQRLLDSSPVELSQCGIPKSRLFTFFDQVHSTGMDVPQAVDALAAVTMSKDITYRDYAQGAFRLRGLGAGQRLHVVVVDEVMRLVIEAKDELEGYTKTNGAAGVNGSSIITEPFAALPPPSPTDILVWLLGNSIRSEGLQHLALVRQRAMHTWRAPAIQTLLSQPAYKLQPLPTAVVAAATAEGCAGDLAVTPTVAHLVSTYKLPIAQDVPCDVQPPLGLRSQIEQDRARFVDIMDGADGHHSADLQLILNGLAGSDIPAASSKSDATGLPSLSPGGDNISKDSPLNLNPGDKEAPVEEQGAAGDVTLLSYDTEQIQEQEQTQEQQREQEEQNQEVKPVDPVGITGWALPELLCGVRSKASGSWPWLPADAFVDADGTAVDSGPMDAQRTAADISNAPSTASGPWRGPRLLMSCNHCRGQRRSTLPSPAKDTGSWELPHRLRDVHVLLTVTVSADAGLVGPDGTAGSPSEQFGLVLTLREAETLRVAFKRLSAARGSQAGGSTATAVASDVKAQFELWRMDADDSLAGTAGALLGKGELEAPAQFVRALREGRAATAPIPASPAPADLPALPPSMSPELVHLSSQARVVDAASWYAKEELHLLFLEAQASGQSPSDRLARYGALLSRRRRDQLDWHGTSIAPYFALPDLAAWTRAATEMTAVAELMRTQHGSLKAAFQAIQAGHERSTASAVADSGTSGFSTTMPAGTITVAALVQAVCSPAALAQLTAALPHVLTGGQHEAHLAGYMKDSVAAAAGLQISAKDVRDKDAVAVPTDLSSYTTPEPASEPARMIYSKFTSIIGTANFVDNVPFVDRSKAHGMGPVTMPAPKTTLGAVVPALHALDGSSDDELQASQLTYVQFIALLLGSSAARSLHHKKDMAAIPAAMGTKHVALHGLDPYLHNHVRSSAHGAASVTSAGPGSPRAFASVLTYAGPVAPNRPVSLCSPGSAGPGPDVLQVDKRGLVSLESVLFSTAAALAGRRVGVRSSKRALQDSSSYTPVTSLGSMIALGAAGWADVHGGAGSVRSAAVSGPKSACDTTTLCVAGRMVVSSTGGIGFKPPASVGGGSDWASTAWAGAPWQSSTGSAAMVPAGVTLTPGMGSVQWDATFTSHDRSSHVAYDMDNQAGGSAVLAAVGIAPAGYATGVPGTTAVRHEQVTKAVPECGEYKGAGLAVVDWVPSDNYKRPTGIQGVLLGRYYVLADGQSLPVYTTDARGLTRPLETMEGDTVRCNIDLPGAETGSEGQKSMLMLQIWRDGCPLELSLQLSAAAAAANNRPYLTVPLSSGPHDRSWGVRPCAWLSNAVPDRRVAVTWRPSYRPAVSHMRAHEGPVQATSASTVPVVGPRLPGHDDVPASAVGYWKRVVEQTSAPSKQGAAIAPAALTSTDLAAAAPANATGAARWLGDLVLALAQQHVVKKAGQLAGKIIPVNCMNLRVRAPVDATAPAGPVAPPSGAAAVADATADDEADDGEDLQYIFEGYKGEDQHGSSGEKAKKGKSKLPVPVVPPQEWVLAALPPPITDSNSGFCTGVLSGVLLTSGKWYYEVRIDISHLTQVGWADLTFAPDVVKGNGCGDDKGSFAFDGDRKRIWSGSYSAFGRSYKTGDIICCAIDLDSRVAYYSLNGCWDSPMGAAILNFKCTGGVAPAFTLEGGNNNAGGPPQQAGKKKKPACRVGVNLGQGGVKSFRFAPPLGFAPVAQWKPDSVSVAADGDATAVVSGALTAAAPARPPFLALHGSDRVVVGPAALLRSFHLVYSAKSMKANTASTAGKCLDPGQAHIPDTEAYKEAQARWKAEARAEKQDWYSMQTARKRHAEQAAAGAEKATAHGQQDGPGPATAASTTATSTAMTTISTTAIATSSTATTSTTAMTVPKEFTPAFVLHPAPHSVQYVSIASSYDSVAVQLPRMLKAFCDRRLTLSVADAVTPKGSVVVSTAAIRVRDPSQPPIVFGFMRPGHCASLSPSEFTTMEKAVPFGLLFLTGDSKTRLPQTEAEDDLSNPRTMSVKAKKQLLKLKKRKSEDKEKGKAKDGKGTDSGSKGGDMTAAGPKDGPSETSPAKAPVSSDSTAPTATAAAEPAVATVPATTSSAIDVTLSPAVPAGETGQQQVATVVQDTPKASSTGKPEAVQAKGSNTGHVKGEDEGTSDSEAEDKSEEDDDEDDGAGSEPDRSVEVQPEVDTSADIFVGAKTSKDKLRRMRGMVKAQRLYSSKPFVDNRAGVYALHKGPASGHAGTAASGLIPQFHGPEAYSLCAPGVLLPGDIISMVMTVEAMSAAGSVIPVCDADDIHRATGVPTADLQGGIQRGRGGTKPIPSPTPPVASYCVRMEAMLNGALLSGRELWLPARDPAVVDAIRGLPGMSGLSASALAAGHYRPSSLHCEAVAARVVRLQPVVQVDEMAPVDVLVDAGSVPGLDPPATLSQPERSRSNEKDTKKGHRQDKSKPAAKADAATGPRPPAPSEPAAAGPAPVPAGSTGDGSSNDKREHDADDEEDGSEVESLASSSQPSVDHASDSDDDVPPLITT